MMPTNHFDPETNPIGPENLPEAYLAGSENFTVLSLYAESILVQADLDVSAVGSGLKVAIEAYQRRLKRNARFFRHQIAPELIRLITSGINYYHTLDPGFELGRQDILGSVDNEVMRRAAAEIFSSLGDRAGEISVDARFLGADFSQTQNSVDNFRQQYEEALTEAIERLENRAQDLSVEIDQIMAAINANICGVVHGALETGAAVTQLGTGILTTISRGNDNSGSSANFAVMAIQGTIQGVSATSQALRDLEANNQLLAAAYQNLANISATGAIAKAIQVQNALFIDALRVATPDAQEFLANWSHVRTGFSDFAGEIRAIDDPEDATRLASTVLGARTIWQALNARLLFTKNSIVSQGISTTDTAA